MIAEKRCRLAAEKEGVVKTEPAAEEAEKCTEEKVLSSATIGSVLVYFSNTVDIL